MNTEQKSLQEAISFHQAGRLEDASSLYDEILQDNPEEPNALHLRGVVWLQLGHYPKAIELIEHAIERQPHVPSFHTHLGLAYKAIGLFEKALVCFENALDWDPDCLDAMNNLGNTLRRVDRYSEAIERFQEVIERDPYFLEAYVNLGNSYRELGQLKEAIAWYERAAELSPDHAVTYNNLGHAMYLAHDVEKASEYFEKAIQLDQGFADPHNNLANILSEQGIFESAVIHYRQALDIDPHYPAPKRGLIELLQHHKLTEYFPWLDAFLLSCYEEDLVAHQELSRTTAQHLLMKQQASPDNTLSSAEAMKIWLSDALLLTFLKKSINVYPAFESLLTDLRSDFLKEYKDNKDLPPEHKTFLCALSLQLYHNDYVFSVNREEESLLEVLKDSVAIDFKLDKVTPITEHNLLLLSLYQPLGKMPFSSALTNHATSAFTPDFNLLLKDILFASLEEVKLGLDIPSFSSEVNEISTRVKAHYEEKPYPKWISTPKLETFSFTQRIHQRFPDIQLPQGSESEVHILVAGCGTGKHPIQTALSYSDVEVTAFDLSLPSLCYAKRMARKYHVEHLEFLHGDILEVDKLNRAFHLIESVGVLHHMQDPLEGWKALSNVLVPKGLMRIGLYSQLGRAVVHRAHQFIEERSITSSDDDIRSFRGDVLSGKYASLNELLFTRDFYTLNECKDYLFHVHEHEFTLDQLSAFLDELGFDFLGFQLNRSVLNQYSEMFPDDKTLRRLDYWTVFEEKYPATFKDLYHFWCQKKS